MIHFGDITNIDGHKLPVVDVVTGGSPCQDLSVAGKRAGLAGERSGLFMEQIRIIKEMREEYVRTHGPDDMVRPRWMVWENVPGAFSSNGGKDFRAVLEETIRIVDPAADVPRPPDGWSPAGCILGDGWSIAWRVHDAQFWGVPQRRRRISLVADFGGESAPEVLFERKSLCWNNTESKQAGERTATGTGGGTNSAKCYRKKAHPVNETLPQNWECATVADTVNAFDNGDMRTPLLVVFEQHSQDGRYNPFGDVCETVSAKYGTGGNNTPIVTSLGTVRRLTPMECERLQGFPDGWTDIGEWYDSKGKKHKEADSPRYKALGNSVAIPFWEWMAGRICAMYDRTVLLGSLFDGIGGFPLAFSRHGAIPVWASEIEEFPIAVTKLHFPEDDIDRELLRIVNGR